MQQNQSQVPPEVELQKITQNPQNDKRDQNEWDKIRNEFASHEESIGQTEDVIALIQKWIWIQSEHQFKQYERQLQQKQHTRALKQIIGDLVQQQKQGSWMINQKYSMEQVNGLVDKLRAKIQSILTSSVHSNPQPQSLLEVRVEEEVKQPILSVQQSEKDLIMNFSGLLPQIKPKGRIYHPKQMTSSFHLLKETEQDYQIKSPHMFSPHHKIQGSPKARLFNNKYLHMTFKYICKQGYNSKGMFEDFSKDADKMTLNKWMIFCKEFQFIDKFHRNELVSIYQNATNFGSVMGLQDFLTAVALLQEKYFNKFHTGQYNFVGEILQIGSEAAFKAKMDNLKVKFSGPRQNFFEYSTYLEHERQAEIEKEKAFQVKRRQRQIVLIKGMFEEQLKDEVNQLKLKRYQKKNNQAANSISMIQTKHKDEKEQKYSQQKSNRVENLNYSKIFHMNRSQSIQKQSKTSTTKTDLTNNMYKTDLIKNELKSKVEHKKIDVRTLRNTNQLKINLPQKPKDIVVSSKAEENTWLTKIRNDSEQSDEILKEHLQLEKKIKNSKQSDKLGDLMRQMQDRAKKVQSIKQQIIKQNEADEDLETQAQFSRKDGKKAIS